MFGTGISKEGDIVDLAADIGVVNKSGAWFAYEGNKIGQGRENAKQYLKDNPEICKEIENKVRLHFNLHAEESKPDIKASSEKEKK